MPIVDDAKEKWTSAINTVVVGATAAEGGTRTSVVTVGGAKGIPFVNFDGPTPCKPVVAMEVWDKAPDDWPESLMKEFADVINSPADWAKKCVDRFGAEMICLKLAGTHPDFGDASPSQSAEVVKSVLKAVGCPLIVWGCDNDEKDIKVLPECCDAAKGEKVMFGSAKQDSYKTLTAACLAGGHIIVGESPIDINIAKQVNILISEMGFPPDRIVMYQTTGALGYGIEYSYSIQERGRLAALSGDKIMAPPVVCLVGQESWRTKEAKVTREEMPQWGDEVDRGALWELTTAVSLLQAGSDILVLRHPRAVAGVKRAINDLCKN